MTQLPKKVKIGGFEWRVLQDQNISEEGQAYGSTHHRHQKIFIEPSETKQKKEQVLLHEVMHAIWWQSGMHTRFKETPKIEEEVIDTLSMGLYQVLKDNKLF